MDEVIKSEIKGRFREAKYKIAFTNAAIDNLKYKDELIKGKFIKVRFKDQRGIYLYWSPIKLKNGSWKKIVFNYGVFGPLGLTNISGYLYTLLIVFKNLN